MKKFFNFLYLVFEPDEKRVNLFIARGRARSNGRDFTAHGLARFLLIYSIFVMLYQDLHLVKIFLPIPLFLFVTIQDDFKTPDWRSVFSGRNNAIWGIVAFLFGPFTFWNDVISNNLIAYPIGTLLSGVIRQGFAIGYVSVYILLTILGTYAVRKVMSVQQKKSDALIDATLWALYSLAVMATLYRSFGWFSDIEEFARLFY